MMTDLRTAGFIFVCIVLPQGLLAALNCSSPTPEALFDAFEKDLFPKKLLRPVKSFSEALNITISITVVGILGVNEKAQTLTTFLWEVLEWDIYGLSWDDKECGAVRVSIPRANLWSPDVHINEFMDKDDSPKSPYVYLSNTGRVFDDKPRRVVSYCRMVIYTFPFDIQNCSLTFAPYLHFGMDITMIQGMTAAEILEESQSVIQTNGEWELADIRVSQDTLLLEEGSYSEIRYNIVLRRRPMLYVVNLLIPSCFLITVDLFSFLLPPQSVDRSAFKMTLILGYTVFLLIMNDLLPVTGETTPLINILFSMSLGLMVASLLETVFITNIHFKSSQYSTVPPWLRTLVLHYMAIIVCLTPAKHSCTSVSQHQSSKVTTLSATSIDDYRYASDRTSSSRPAQDLTLLELRRLNTQIMNIRVQVDQHIQGSMNSEDWVMVGIIIDRLLFGIYLLFILITFSCFLCIWILSYSYIK